MRYLTLFCVALIVGIVGALSWTDGRLQQYERQAKARESLLQDSLARTILQQRTDSVEVTRWVTRTEVAADTLLWYLTDTVKVKEFIYQTDTLRQSCLACIASASRLKVYADSLIRFQDSLLKVRRPTWKQRFGISCGYSAVRLGNDVKAGPSCGAAFRVWP